MAPHIYLYIYIFIYLFTVPQILYDHRYINDSYICIYIYICTINPGFLQLEDPNCCSEDRFRGPRLLASLLVYNQQPGNSYGLMVDISWYIYMTLSVNRDHKPEQTTTALQSSHQDALASREPRCCPAYLGTLWLFNIAMENGPFIDGLPVAYLKLWFSMAMLNNPMVTNMYPPETHDVVSNKFIWAIYGCGVRFCITWTPWHLRKTTMWFSCQITKWVWVLNKRAQHGPTYLLGAMT